MLVTVESLLIRFLLQVIVPAIFAGVMVYLILSLCLWTRKDDDENGR